MTIRRTIRGPHSQAAQEHAARLLNSVPREKQSQQKQKSKSTLEGIILILAIKFFCLGVIAFFVYFLSSEFFLILKALAAWIGLSFVVGSIILYAGNNNEKPLSKLWEAVSNPLSAVGAGIVFLPVFMVVLGVLFFILSMFFSS